MAIFSGLVPLIVTATMAQWQPHSFFPMFSASIPPGETVFQSVLFQVHPLKARDIDTWKLDGQEVFQQFASTSHDLTTHDINSGASVTFTELSFDGSTGEKVYENWIRAVTLPDGVNEEVFVDYYRFTDRNSVLLLVDATSYRLARIVVVRRAPPGGLGGGGQ